MNTFFVHPEGELAEWLIKDGIEFPEHGFEIPEEKFTKLIAEAKKAHPKYSPDRQRHWALYQIIAQNKVSGQTVQALGDSATQDISHWVRMSQTQSLGFKLLREKVDTLCEGMQGYCERQDSGVKEIVQASVQSGDLIIVELAKLSEITHQQWAADREDREAEAGNRAAFDLAEKKAYQREQLFLWAWRLALTALLAWKL